MNNITMRTTHLGR